MNTIALDVRCQLTQKVKGIYISKHYTSKAESTLSQHCTDKMNIFKNKQKNA